MGTMDQAQGSHFFFMSLYTPGDVHAPGSVWRRSGHFTPPPGMTRHDAYEMLMGEITEDTPALAGATVLAFDVQPNQL
ncbi:hypothetical protein GCM10010353_17060 [Streptomyces chryseus]|nr:hypothetical protein GCM10010353_17060 [Streptomyces chryseus]